MILDTIRCAQNKTPKQNHIKVTWHNPINNLTIIHGVMKEPCHEIMKRGGGGSHYQANERLMRTNGRCVMHDDYDTLHQEFITYVSSVPS